MSEPRTSATETREIAPGIFHWTIMDGRVKFRSEAFAVVKGDETVLIDPLPLAEEAMASLPNISAIILTGSCHQRSAWSFRKKLGVKVHAPVDGAETDEKADILFKEGDELPCGLKPFFMPGTIGATYPLLLPRDEGWLFGADLMVREGDLVRFLPDEYIKDRESMIKSTRRVLTLPFDGLCLAHGEPLVKGGHDAVEKALQQVNS
jgi:glyoxylase-like metal-dependent hydrolase (beta-lactamase superfamily II)